MALELEKYMNQYAQRKGFVDIDAMILSCNLTKQDIIKITRAYTRSYLRLASKQAICSINTLSHDARVETKSITKIELK